MLNLLMTKHSTEQCLSLSLYLSLSLCLNSHFPGGPVLAGARMSPFWNLLELMVIEMVVISGAIRRAKLQSKCHHQQANTSVQQCVYGKPPMVNFAKFVDIEKPSSIYHYVVESSCRAKFDKNRLTHFG